MADEKNPPAISAISIKGFKSFLDEQRIEIRPLTLLAGANSSGKSSAIQPLLLLKQTLEAPFAPDSLLLDGPNVRFTSARQFLARSERSELSTEFFVMIEDSRGGSLKSDFEATTLSVFLKSSVLIDGEKEFDLRVGRNPFSKGVYKVGGSRIWDARVTRDRGFLGLEPNSCETAFELLEKRSHYIELVRAVIHVPALRGNPARAYRTSAVGSHFPGTFENYVASMILAWQTARDFRFQSLRSSFFALGLTEHVRSKAIDATQVEILVGRLSDKNDLVNIADVGLGVSQVLPVLVALLAAKPGQLVYLEHPEIHLHPRAQQALATVLADAANRGVRVVAETHSPILLLAVQTLVAEGKISPDKVMLHWFQQDARGATKVTSGEMDQLGAYGDWPEDFGEVEAAVDNRYLDAVELKALPRKQRAKK